MTCSISIMVEQILYVPKSINSFFYVVRAFPVSWKPKIIKSQTHSLNGACGTRFVLKERDSLMYVMCVGFVCTFFLFDCNNASKSFYIKLCIVIPILTSLAVVNKMEIFPWKRWWTIHVKVVAFKIVFKLYFISCVHHARNNSIYAQNILYSVHRW